MIKILSYNYFAFQKPNGQCDVYTLGQKCEVVKCVTCLNAREAIMWVSRKESSRG